MEKRTLRSPLLAHEFYRRLLRLAPSLSDMAPFTRPKVGFLCAQDDFGFAITPSKAKTHEAMVGKVEDRPYGCDIEFEHKSINWVHQIAVLILLFVVGAVLAFVGWVYAVSLDPVMPRGLPPVHATAEKYVSNYAHWVFLTLPALKLLTLAWSNSRKDPQIPEIAPLVERAALSEEASLIGLQRAELRSQGIWEIETPLSPLEYLTSLEKEEQREVERIGAWEWQLKQESNSFRLSPPPGRRRRANSLRISGEILTNPQDGSVIVVTMTGGIEMVRRHALEMLTSCGRPDIDLVYRDLLEQR